MKSDMEDSFRQQEIGQLTKHNLNSLDHDNEGFDFNGQRDSDSSHNEKRFRRTAEQITRKFMCWCGKAYGSENSLN